MTDKPHRLIWIDTETTGISPRNGQLLEVAMMLTDMQGMERPANAIEDVAWQWIIRHDAIRLTPATAYAITELHSRNGLIDDVFGPESDTTDSATEGIHDLARQTIPNWPKHPAGTHRALDCLTRDIAEYRTIIDTIKEHQ